jgi:hypothetical protein
MAMNGRRDSLLYELAARLSRRVMTFGDFAARPFQNGAAYGGLGIKTSAMKDCR